jgi:signal transduction histidine kinase
LASSGAQALALLQQEVPDLILLDVMMPDMDGYEVTRRVRAIKDLPFIPILLITASDRASSVKGLDLGADEFIRKPIEAEELLARVRSLLRLKHSIAERDRTAQQRQDFVSRLTHDLRTPLVAAGRMLELLQSGVLGEIPAQAKEAMAVMARSNQNLLEMVNKLLDIYRYEAGSKVLNQQDIDLLSIVKEVMAELQPIAQSKALFLRLEDLPENCPPVIVKGDRLELLRVFNNLIGNGLKFTDKGGVSVKISPQGQQVHIAITDTGVGIPEQEIPFFVPAVSPRQPPQTGQWFGTIPFPLHCLRPSGQYFRGIPTQKRQYLHRASAACPFKGCPASLGRSLAKSEHQMPSDRR